MECLINRSWRGWLYPECCAPLSTMPRRCPGQNFSVRAMEHIAFLWIPGPPCPVVIADLWTEVHRCWSLCCLGGYGPVFILGGW